MSNVTLNVDGMSCEHCKNAVEKALKTLEGVQGAQVNLEAKTVDIDFDSQKTDEQKIKGAITEAGYEVK